MEENPKNSVAVASNGAPSTNITQNFFNGNDYDTIIAAMPESKKSECLALARDIDPTNFSSIREYGSDISHSIGTFSDAILKKNGNATDISIEPIMNELLVTLNLIDVKQFDDTRPTSFIKRIPIINRIIRGTKDMMDKTATVATKVKKIEDQIQMCKTMADADNNMLQSMEDNIKECLAAIREHIIGGKLKIKELTEEYERMKASNAEGYELTRMANVLTALEKRVNDLIGQESILSTEILWCEMMITNNYNVGDSAENAITNIVPMWKQQINMAMSAQKTKTSNDAMVAFHASTNKLIEENSETIKRLTIDVAKQAGLPTFAPETVKKCCEDICEMMDQKIRLNAEDEKRRADYERQIREYCQRANQKLLEMK